MNEWNELPCDGSDVEGNVGVDSWEFEVLVEYRDHILVMFESTSKLLVDPVLAVVVVVETLEGIWCQYKDEVLRRLNVLQQRRVKLPGIQLVDIDKHLGKISTKQPTTHLVATKLQKNFYK